MHGRPAARTTERAGESHPQRWRVLGVLVLALLVTSIDHTIINIALPQLAVDLGASASELQWVVDSYTLVFAGLLLIAGALGDRFGRKSALNAGLAMFAAGSVVAAMASSVDAVIVGRAVMGVGGALIMPATLSLLVNVFGDPRERAKAIGVWAAASGAGIAVGPIVGGVLMREFSWASVFWINVPLLAAAVLGSLLLVPQSRDERAQRLDPVGAVLSVIAISSTTYAVIEAPVHGWTSGTTAGIAGVGGAAAVAFVIWSLRRRDPMLDVRLFRSPAFSAASASLTLLFFAMSGAMFLQAQYLQFVLEYSPLGAGAALIPAAFGILVGTGVGSHVGSAHGGRITVAAGTLVSAAGLLVQAQLADGGSYGPTGFGLLLFGLGAGIAMPAATDSVMSAVPVSRSGVGSAVNDTTREVGAALGVAVVGSVAATAYTTAMREQAAVPALPDALREAVNDNIGAAVAAGGQLGAEGAALVAAAQDAFVTSMSSALWVAAAVALWATVIAVAHLPRHAPTHGIHQRPAKRS
jgi:EmrB/QacA subfamily drug resistance transporter